jgi:methionyl-tRNA formyltransferase
MNDQTPSGRYVVAAVHAWNRRIFEDVLAQYPGEWVLIDQPGDLTAARLADLRPRYVFLLHWSQKVPKEIVEQYECVGFHMTDLPYGRGGSPLQNLILRGHRETTLTAFRLVEEMDAGPVYLKAGLPLDGSAEEIYIRASKLAAALIGQILERRPVPIEQHGEAVVFGRRIPDQSRLPESATPQQLYDFIRMLDAEGYPRAFLERGTWRCEFLRATLDGDVVRAEARISPIRAPRSS